MTQMIRPLLVLGARVFHRFEVYTVKEIIVRDKCMAETRGKVIKRKTTAPIIIGMIGIVGSGKTSVAEVLAETLGAVLISGDDIRVKLRKEKERYEGTRKIAEDLAVEALKLGGNVVIDSDFIDEKKRSSLIAKAKKVRARVLFVRVFADPDVIIGRIMANPANDFFRGASSVWKGDSAGNVVKLREFWRRTPRHFTWRDRTGGEWRPKKLPVRLLADVNTSDEAVWRQQVRWAASQLLQK